MKIKITQELESEIKLYKTANRDAKKAIKAIDILWRNKCWRDADHHALRIADMVCRLAK